MGEKALAKVSNRRDRIALALIACGLVIWLVQTVLFYYILVGVAYSVELAFLGMMAYSLSIGLLMVGGFLLLRHASFRSQRRGWIARLPIIIGLVGWGSGAIIQSILFYDGVIGDRLIQAPDWLLSALGYCQVAVPLYVLGIAVFVVYWLRDEVVFVRAS